MRNITVLAATAVALAGCADSAHYLRSRPVTYFPGEQSSSETLSSEKPISKNLAVPKPLNQLITLHCVKEEASPYADGNTQFTECLYVSAEFNPLWSGTEKADVDTSKPASKKAGSTKKKGATLNSEQDLAVSYLLDISDMNCSNFMQRAFAMRSSAGFANNLTRDLAAGFGAVTAFSSPALSAGLGVTSLIVGSGVKSFDAEYFLNESFQAMESAIAAERLRIRTSILLNRANPDPAARYGIAEALSDVRAYDDACSFKSGLSQLAKLAKEKKTAAEASKLSAELKPLAAIDAAAAVK